MPTILHCDLNCFYASVEMLLDPKLRNKPIAVCGSTDTRHGIVLAKSEPAKKAGVKTGQANWEARQACPGLIIVPPQYDQYVKFSHLVRDIYYRYTDLVEPFGMDECWLDVTACLEKWGSGEEIADEIRRTVKEEIGLTLSVGVSFNKIFAKLGSDMKKPDATTVIDKSNWKEKVLPLPVSDLLYIGHATTRKLMLRGIYTIGQLASTDENLLRSWFGVNGSMLYRFANGLDTSRVMHRDYKSEIKSVGHGITCSRDLINEEEVWRVILELSQDVGHRLRHNALAANGIMLTVRASGLGFEQYQTPLPYPSQSPLEIAQTARIIFCKNYQWNENVRAITVSAQKLSPQSLPDQIDFFGDSKKREKRRKFDDAVDTIRGRFGDSSIRPLTLVTDLAMPDDGRHLVKMPSIMFS